MMKMTIHCQFILDARSGGHLGGCGDRGTRPHRIAGCASMSAGPCAPRCTDTCASYNVGTCASHGSGICAPHVLSNSPIHYKTFCALSFSFILTLSLTIIVGFDEHSFWMDPKHRMLQEICDLLLVGGITFWDFLVSNYLFSLMSIKFPHIYKHKINIHEIKTYCVIIYFYFYEYQKIQICLNNHLTILLLKNRSPCLFMSS